jgi:hypothetical protein
MPVRTRRQAAEESARERVRLPHEVLCLIARFLGESDLPDDTALETLAAAASAFWNGANRSQSVLWPFAQTCRSFRDIAVKLLLDAVYLEFQSGSSLVQDLNKLSQLTVQHGTDATRALRVVARDLHNHPSQDAAFALLSKWSNLQSVNLRFYHPRHMLEGNAEALTAVMSSLPSSVSAIAVTGISYPQMLACFGCARVQQGEPLRFPCGSKLKAGS